MFAVFVAIRNVRGMEAWACPRTAFESSAELLSEFKQARQKAETEADAATAGLRAATSTYNTLVRMTAEHTFGVGVRKECQEALCTSRDAIVWCVAKHIDIADGASFQTALNIDFLR